MVQRCVLTRKMDSPLRTLDDFVVAFFLTGIKEGKAAAKVLHRSPHDARSTFDEPLTLNLWMESFDVLRRLLHLIFNA